MSRLVVSFPGCADRLEDVVLFSAPSDSSNQVGDLDGSEHLRDDPMGIVISPMTPTIPYDIDERQADSFRGASSTPPDSPPAAIVDRLKWTGQRGVPVHFSRAS